MTDTKQNAYDAPERIYLDGAPDVKDCPEGRNWCDHAVFDDNIEYVRADLPTDADRKAALEEYDQHTDFDLVRGKLRFLTNSISEKTHDTIRRALQRPSVPAQIDQPVEQRFDVAKVREVVNALLGCEFATFFPNALAEYKELPLATKRARVNAYELLDLLNTPAAEVMHIGLDLAKGEDRNGVVVAHDKTMTVAPQWLADFVAKHLHDPEPPAAEVPEVINEAAEIWNRRAHALSAPYAPSEGYISCLFTPEEIKAIDAALAKLKAAPVEKNAGVEEAIARVESMYFAPNTNIADKEARDAVVQAARAYAAQSTGKGEE